VVFLFKGLLANVSESYLVTIRVVVQESITGAVAIINIMSATGRQLILII
jgi:hypothetical protein